MRPLMILIQRDGASSGLRRAMTEQVGDLTCVAANPGLISAGPWISRPEHDWGYPRAYLVQSIVSIVSTFLRCCLYLMPSFLNLRWFGFLAWPRMI